MGIKRNKILWLVILALVFVGIAVPISRADRFLVRDDQLEKADALVMLMGSVADRVLQTADLYHAGYAPEVLVVEAHMTGLDSLLVRGVEVVSNSGQVVSYLQDLSVPDSAITLLPGRAKSTLEEAQAVSRYLRSRSGIERLIVVTSPGHTRRASLIFRNTIRKEHPGTEVLVSPAIRYQEIHKKPWWRRKEGIQAVTYEYIKLLSYLLIEQH